MLTWPLLQKKFTRLSSPEACEDCFETPVRLQVRPAGMNFSFRHIIAGTRPDVNRPGALQSLEVDVAPQATGQAFTYPTPGEENGQEPIRM